MPVPVAQREHSRISIRVGINCLSINPAFVGGVTTYALGLIEGFARERNDCTFRIFVTRDNQHLFEALRKYSNLDISPVNDEFLSLRSKIRRAALLSHNGDIYKLTSDLMFDRVRAVMDAESDVLYTPTPVLGYFNSHRPTVLSMHDIQHLHHPEFFTWPTRLSRRITYALSARYAGFLQASSRFIKDDLLQHFPWLSPEQIEVIPSGVLIDKFSMRRKANLVAARYGLPERFLLFP